MTDESDIPGFPAGPTTPLGNINGLPVAPKKAASGLLKRLMMHAKPAPKMKAKPSRNTSRGRSSRRGIEANSKVHFGKRPVKWY